MPMLRMLPPFEIQIVLTVRQHRHHQPTRLMISSTRRPESCYRGFARATTVGTTLVVGEKARNYRCSTPFWPVITVHLTSGHPNPDILRNTLIPRPATRLTTTIRTKFACEES